MIPVVTHQRAGPGDQPVYFLARLKLTRQGVLEDVSPKPYPTARAAQDAAEMFAVWGVRPIQWRIYACALPRKTP